MVRGIFLLMTLCDRWQIEIFWFVTHSFSNTGNICKIRFTIHTINSSLRNLDTGIILKWNRIKWLTISCIGVPRNFVRWGWLNKFS